MTQRPPSPPPIYNENGSELEQPIVINPRTGKPKLKRRFARRYASLILAHVAKENAAKATREALEYRARREKALKEAESMLAAKKAELAAAHASASSHGMSLSGSGTLTSFFSRIIHTRMSRSKRAEEKRKQEEQLKEEALRLVVGEDPTQRAAGKKDGDGGDVGGQIETLHQSGNIFNAVLRASRKDVDALLRVNPHVLSQRGSVGDLPLHVCFLMNTPAHHVLAFYIMGRCPHVVAEPYWGVEYTGENILHIVIIKQNLRMVERLVKREPALLQARATGRFFSEGQPCYYGEYPLSFAACTGHKEMVSLLLQHGAELDAVDSNGNNVLHLMVIHRRQEMYSFIKSKWIELNESKPIDQRATGSNILWLRRNNAGYTPFTLSAHRGDFDMFSFLLEEEKVVQWKYGPVSCYVYPLAQIDLPLANEQEEKKKRMKQTETTSTASANLPRPRKYSMSDDEDDDEDDRRGALEIIVNMAHLDLLMHPRMVELIKQKWERFASRIFFQRFLFALLYILLFTCATIHRQSENVNGMQQWAHFEEAVEGVRAQVAREDAAVRQRANIEAGIERQAASLQKAQNKLMEDARARARAGDKKDDAAAQLDGDDDAASSIASADVAALRAELLSALNLPPLPSVLLSTRLSAIHIDLDVLYSEMAEYRSARLAHWDPDYSSKEEKEKEKDKEDDDADGSGQSSTKDSSQQQPSDTVTAATSIGESGIDYSTLSDDELAAILRAPPPLLGMGLLDDLPELIYHLALSPLCDWPDLIWSYPCFLFLAELLVLIGAALKGLNEIEEMRERGVRSYFGARGSSFLENTLSLSFCILVAIVLILSLLGSGSVRVAISLCSMIGWCYMFFFLLAFRMTGPMVVMIFKMVTGDVMRFLAVFSVFLLAFAQAFFVLFERDGFEGMADSVKTCFLAMLGDFEFDDYIQSPFMLMSVVLLVLYVVVITILLLNLLVAMMGDTYSHVNENAEKQWHLERARIIFAIEHEMGSDERGKKSNKYWTVINGCRYLQVLVEESDHFRRATQHLSLDGCDEENAATTAANAAMAADHANKEEDKAAADGEADKEAHARRQQ